MKEGTREGSDEGRVSEGAVSIARIDRLRNSMPGKDSLIDELINLFVSDLPKRLSAIAHAVEHGDAPALALEAHALRGGAANFGALQLDELCGKLEDASQRGAVDQAPAMLDELRRESARVRDALVALKSQHRATPTDAPAPSQRSRLA
jgi:HPt (histidine-containing phosphotransfer) domain-containing protein